VARILSALRSKSVEFGEELGNWPLGLDCALLLRRKADPC